MMVKLLVICCFMTIILAGVQSAISSDLNVALQKYLDVSKSGTNSKLLGLDNIAIALQVFNLFKAEFNRIYASANEELARFAAFQQSLKTILLIDVEDQGNSSFNVGLNEFSDWTPDEIDGLHGYEPIGDDNSTIPQFNGSIPLPSTDKTARDGKISYSNVSASYDLTQMVVSGTNTPVLRPIKNQQSCGSCWAFAFVALLEYQFATQMKTSRDLSEQQFVDCSSQNSGCNGGNFVYSWSYLSQNLLRVDSTSAYPYLNKQQWYCYFTTTGAAQFSGLDAWVIETGDVVAQMKYYLNYYGPLFIHIYAGGPVYSPSSNSIVSPSNMNEISSTFSGYSSGVYNVASCANWKYGTNHAVVLVGYGVDSKTGLPYWKVRNSWGTTWGEQGYFRIRSGVNLCGIESQSYFISPA